MEDRRFFETIPIEITHRVFSDERNYKETKKAWNVDAQSFQQLAREAHGETERLTPSVRCVVSMRDATNASFTRKEHFVPEGLGFDWTAPQAGIGTCDEINARFGKYECEWLRQGKMGIFRPFFVGHGKDEAPAYYAPTMKRPHFWFTRDAETGKRTLVVSPDVKVDLPDRAGPAELLIRVPHNEARSEWVSLALHKMALLMFWLCEGPLAFDAAFADLRMFLLEPGEETYRGFIEQMRQGDCPGVELRYLVLWRPVDGKVRIDSVHCTMKVHHMRYCIVLVGTHEIDLPGHSWTPWVDPTTLVPDRTTISFNVGTLERIPG